MWNAARRWRRAVSRRCRTVLFFSSLRGPGPSSAPSGSCQEKGLVANKVIDPARLARHAQRQTRAARKPRAPAAWKRAACAASPWWRADSTSPLLATLSFSLFSSSTALSGFLHSRTSGGCHSNKCASPPFSRLGCRCAAGQRMSRALYRRRGRRRCARPPQQPARAPVGDQRDAA